MSGKTEVRVQSLRVSLTNQNRILLLKEIDGPLSLPLFIGQFEAEAIVLALQNIEISRPQPHDLIRDVIIALDGRILSAEISVMKASTFYAEILIENADGAKIHLDCRPSDAISVALRAHVPIYVDRELMQAYGILPEPDVRTQKAQQDQQSDTDEDDLSAFSDFLSNF